MKPLSSVVKKLLLKQRKEKSRKTNAKAALITFFGCLRLRLTAAQIQFPFRKIASHKIHNETISSSKPCALHRRKFETGCIISLEFYTCTTIPIFYYPPKHAENKTYHECFCIFFINLPTIKRNSRLAHRK